MAPAISHATGISHAAGILDELEDALDAVLTLPLGLLERGELASLVCRTESGLATKMAAFRARVVAAADDARVSVDHGVRSTDQLVASMVPVDPARVRSDGRLGRWLEFFPVFAAAFAAGRLSRDHLELLRKADHNRVHLELRASQDMLVDAALTVDWSDWEHVVGYWLLAADPDGQIPKEQLCNRRFSMTKHADGSWSGEFRLDAVSGQAVKNTVSMEAQRLLDVDSELGVTRSSADRRADAFVGVVARGAERESRDLPAPFVHLVVGEALAEDMVRKAVADDSGPLEASPTDVNRRCEFADGTPVHPNTAMAALAVATFQRLVLDSESRVLDLARNARCFPKDIRLALLAAARGRCRTPGCDAPYAWLQADHIHAWGRHGPTSPDNGQALCGPDNRFKSDR